VHVCSQEIEVDGEVQLDLGVERQVVSCLVQRMLEQIDRRLPVQAVEVNAAESGENFGTPLPRGRRAQHFLENGTRPGRVAALKRVLRFPQAEAPDRLRVARRGEQAGARAQIGSRVLRSTPRGPQRRFLERERDLLVGPFRCEREMVGALLQVGDEISERAVKLPPPGECDALVGSRGEKRVREADLLAGDLDDTRLDRGLEPVVGVAGHRRREQARRRLRHRGGHRQRILRLVRKCRDPLRDQVSELVGHGQRFSRREAALVACQRLSELERVERVAAGELVQPPHHRP
jgi:hypothetical protein